VKPVTNSELGCYQRCEREWQHRYLDHREGLLPAEPLERGTRIHAAQATWWAGGKFDIDTMPPIERAMLLGYHARYERPHLRSVRVNVAVRVAIGGVDVVGECDAVGEDDEGRTVIVEHKTTSRDITPGSQWWREKIHVDPQPSTYLAAFPGATVLYNVLRVPDLEQLSATPEEKRKYTKPKKDEPSRLYAGHREKDETDDEYIARILADMSDNLGKYFQRATIVRLDSEREAFRFDVSEIAFRIRSTKSDGTTPRNPHACFQFGRACDFFSVCWEGKDIEEMPNVERNHSEEILDRWEKRR
jgi:PD-(D/E)XK nuclease superfamily